MRDRRVRREPVAPNTEPSEAIETPAEASASPTIPAAAVYGPTLEQPAAPPDTWAPLPPIRVHDEDLRSTAPMPTVPPTIDFPIDEKPRSRVAVGAGAVFGVGLAILSIVIAFLVVTRRVGSPPLTSEATSVPPASSEQPVTTPVTTVAVSSAPSTAAPTAVTTTVAPVTAAPTTAAPTTAVPTSVAETVAPTTVPATTTAAPTTAAPAPIAGPGTPLPMRDPLPSGVSFADASPSFALEQQLADALAAGDWNVVRKLEPSKARLSDSELAAGYAGLDRASLILVDARRQRDGYRDLLVSVANERNGAQTSLYCLQWAASTATGSVVENGGIGKFATTRGTLSAKDVLADPTLVDLITRRCVWR